MVTQKPREVYLCKHKRSGEKNWFQSDNLKSCEMGFRWTACWKVTAKNLINTKQIPFIF